MGSMVKQLHNVVMGRSVKQVGRGSDLQEAPLFQYRDAIAELQRLIDVVGNHDHGFFEVLLKPQELTLEFVTGNCVERAKGFIEQDDPGIGREGSRKGHALSLPTGEFNRITRLKLVRIKMNEVQERVHPARSPFRFPSEQQWHEADVFFDGPMRQQSGVLLYVPDMATKIYGVFDSYRFAMNANLSRIGLRQPVEHPEQGRFAGPAFPDQDQGFAFNHFEVDVLEDSNVRAECLAHVADTQDGCVHLSPLSFPQFFAGIQYFFLTKPAMDILQKRGSRLPATEVNVKSHKFKV